MVKCLRGIIDIVSAIAAPLRPHTDGQQPMAIAEVVTRFS
jgi:hypothetical protein